ncbi:hypothetical protein AWC35_20770 [Gibbsiella quercinecans]|uniref:Uncharacterized protein n=1 Tax=Gibbsiella quercinecans TaxID=929813 RepID=A0A250B5R5_9GAMM|nr:hypothetical protein AWC35_20770 [Gibbsiella quercinecans]RLM02899.1 hypothetical protein BIY31_22805 [Gibbsiella quercinecans]RLM06196.1 hypothetical protein BIY30_16680 [Gibbsiella quercinecans]
MLLHFQPAMLHLCYICNNRLAAAGIWRNPRSAPQRYGVADTLRFPPVFNALSPGETHEKFCAKR